MSKFDDLKKKKEAADAAERARQEQEQAEEERQQVHEKEQAARVALVVERVLRPALGHMAKELTLKNAQLTTPKAKFSVTMTKTEAPKQRMSFNGYAVVELTFERATRNSKWKAGFLFGVDRPHNLWLFSGAERPIRYPGEPEPFTESGVPYNKGRDLEFEIKGTITDEMLTALRNQIDDILVEDIEPFISAA